MSCSASAAVSGDGCPVATATSQAWTAASRAQAAAASSGVIVGTGGSGVLTDSAFGSTAAQPAVAACTAFATVTATPSSSMRGGLNGSYDGNEPVPTMAAQAC